MSSRTFRAARADEIAPGGMKSVVLDTREIVVCNCSGIFHAVSRRCGHMNAPLELGTLDGQILTCPMHCAQFDVATGQLLAGPVPAHLDGVVLPPSVATYLANVGALMQHIRAESIAVYPTIVDGGWVSVELPPADSGSS